MSNKQEVKKISIVGMGYVGTSLGLLLAKKNSVIIYDIDTFKVSQLNKKLLPIKDTLLEEYIIQEKLNFLATTDKNEAFNGADFIIIAIPTDFDNKLNSFDISKIDELISDILEINNSALIIIKSTLPVGTTKKLNKKFNTTSIVFSPEFLREGNALIDNLYPSRIILGSDNHCEKGDKFIEILMDAALEKNINLIKTGSMEAEAIKLFSNSYLAMRVAFFNELDNFCMDKNISAADVVEGVSLDKRIGNFYNNPSFGYGGYCLPKDTKQLQADFGDIPSSTINAITVSNNQRIKYIAKQIIKLNPLKVGFYRLIMKSNSDNFRESSSLKLLEEIKKHLPNIIIYEPSISNKSYIGLKILNDLEVFKEECDLILTNRITCDLEDCIEKVFSRDLFGND